MIRVSSSVTRRNKHKKIIRHAKGYRGRSNCYRLARSRVEKGWQYAYRDRKVFKREIRSLWIVRINAALRGMDLTYSRFINMLNKSTINIDRKHLSNLAYENLGAFKKVVNSVMTAA